DKVTSLEGSVVITLASIAAANQFYESNSADYEKILSDLDSNIRKAELRRITFNVQEKRLLSHWLIYSVLVWVGYIAFFTFYLHKQYFYDPHWWSLALAPVVMGLPVIYVGHLGITEWYKHAKSNEESYLDLLRANQRLKVEELKKKTAYYSTKTLLERYDPASLRPNGQRILGQDVRPVSERQKGQPNPQQPNMMDPGLRQRQGLGVVSAQGIPVSPGRPMGVLSGVRQSRIGQGPQNGLYGPQQPPFNPEQPHLSNARPYPHEPHSTERHWYDKIVDVIVGDDGPDTKYALICGKCYAHCGLALPQELDDIQYICPKCNFFNLSRRKTRMAAAGIQPPSSIEHTLLQAQNKPLPASRDPSPSPSAHRLPHPDHHHHRQDEPGLQEGNSPERVLEPPSFGECSDHSESDYTGFVSNWNDSDAKGVDHGEGDEGNAEKDDTKGYIVDSGDSSNRLDQGKEETLE
ncbi:hypothetical protein BGZ65_003897, partial [Modicella reniformis]